MSLLEIFGIGFAASSGVAATLVALVFLSGLVKKGEK